MDAEGTEGAEEAIEFDFGLGVALLVLIPGDGSKTRGTTLAIFTLLREDPPDGTPGGVDRKEDWAGGSIVDGNESGRGDDGVLDILHRLLMLFLPGEVGIFACEVDERSGQRGVVVDPNMHCPCCAKEHADIRDRFARWPGADFCYF